MNMTTIREPRILPPQTVFLLLLVSFSLVGSQELWSGSSSSSVSQPIPLALNSQNFRPSQTRFGSQPYAHHNHRKDRDNDEKEDIFEPLQIPCEINGVTIPAIIDTGAQITIMSEACAQKCRISGLIDGRYSGRAVGIGSSVIVGRIEDLSMRMGPLSWNNRVSILRESNVDLIIGLDFLRRFKAEISMDERLLKLRVRNKIVRVPFISSQNPQLATYQDMVRRNDRVHNADDYRGYEESESLLMSTSSSFSSGAAAAAGGGAAAATAAATGRPRSIWTSNGQPKKTDRQLFGASDDSDCEYSSAMDRVTMEGV